MDISWSVFIPLFVAIDVFGAVPIFLAAIAVMMIRFGITGLIGLHR